MKQMQAREAKAKFSEVLDTASKGEATTITRHGAPVAMVVPIEDGEKLYRTKDTKTFGEYLLEFPGPLEIERDHTPPREIDL